MIAAIETMHQPHRIGGELATAVPGEVAALFALEVEGKIDELWLAREADVRRGKHMRGLGQRQLREIIDYNGTTKVATVSSTWGTNPDNTSTFVVAKGFFFDKAPAEILEVRRPFYNAAANASGCGPWSSTGAAERHPLIRSTIATIRLLWNAQVPHRRCRSGWMRKCWPMRSSD